MLRIIHTYRLSVVQCGCSINSKTSGPCNCHRDIIGIQIDIGYTTHYIGDLVGVIVGVGVLVGVTVGVTVLVGVIVAVTVGVGLT